MSEPPDSLKAPVEESGGKGTTPTPPMSPTQPRSFLDRLFKRRRSAGGFIKW